MAESLNWELQVFTLSKQHDDQDETRKNKWRYEEAMRDRQREGVNKRGAVSLRK